MADDADKSTQPVQDEIHLDDPQAVQRWTERFGVNEDQLRAAVRSAGNNALAVRTYLEAR